MAGLASADGRIPASAVPAITVAPQRSDADDAVAIRAAIRSVATSGGGTVELTAGHYTLRSPLFLKSNVVLQGQGEIGHLRPDPRYDHGAHWHPSGLPNSTPTH